MGKDSRLPIKTVYYTSEENDEFSSARIEARTIGKDYVYINKSLAYRAVRFILHKIIAPPIAFPFVKIFLGQRIKNRRVLRPFRKKGYFIYANHTHPTGDAVMPSTMLFPKSVFTVVHPANVSMPVMGKLTPYLGAIPTPSSIGGLRSFKNAIEKRILEGAAVVIYPEAHIWPYYTGIRHFAATSFSFPVDFDEPCFAMTNTYQKRRFSKKPRVVTYIDGPFYKNSELSRREQPDELRDRIYAVMLERAGESTCEYIRYVKKNEEKGEESQDD
ncbi:MAG: hypothetical protein J6Q68_01470 [Clostridia bacterium]|nr:hypothetical protein [Clostridia bacterium]